MSNLKRTALYEQHVKLGGKIVDFAGWELPIQYEGLVAEHNAVRNQCGMFDVSHMGEVLITGPKAEDFVDYLVCNDVKSMADNQIIYCMMCYEDGGIVDDLLVYKYNTEKYFLVINGANVEKDVAWMEKQSEKFDATVDNRSDVVSEIALQGPNAQALLQELVGFNLDEIEFFFFKDEVEVAGAKCLVSRTGYTGEDGFEIYASAEDIVKVWEALLAKGEPHGLKPCGLGCRDTLRFEVALPLYGNEIDKDITPLEAGLGFFVKLEAGDFIGKDVLVKQKAEGVPRKLVGFELLDKGVPRHGYDVVKDGKTIGVVTTGYQSPSVGKTIGLALVEAEHGVLGGEFEIQIRKKTAKAQIIKKRFYVKKYKK